MMSALFGPRRNLSWHQLVKHLQKYESWPLFFFCFTVVTMLFSFKVLTGASLNRSMCNKKSEKKPLKSSYFPFFSNKTFLFKSEHFFKVTQMYL